MESNKDQEKFIEKETVLEEPDLFPPGTDVGMFDDRFADKTKENQEASLQEIGKLSNTTNIPDKEIKRRSFKILRKSIHPPTLLEKLLTNNIEKERDELLQCIRYVVDNNFLQK